MRAPPDASTIRAFLARARRRLRVLAAAEGAAAGLLVAAVIALGLRSSATQAAVTGITLAAIGVAVRLNRLSRRDGPIAELVEQRAGGCRNIVVTATELIERPVTVRPDIGERVFRDAGRVIGRLEPRAIFPARRAGTALGAAAIAWVTALVLVAPGSAAPSSARDVPLEAVAITDVEATVAPPAYASRPAQSLRDPSRIEALSGSRIALRVRAVAESVIVETLGGQIRLARDGERTFSGELVADADGYIAVAATASDGRPGVRRLIGLSVTPDRPPRVRVTVPGRDLFISDVGRTLDVGIEADDDLGLASLRLRYTKVSGVGERFTFTDGETPLEIVRTDERTWRARGRLALAPLELGPGDVVVYRGVAADRRPGAPPAESDAFLVEITSPGAVASEGFAMDDEMDRYAVSQQMVILRTERLIAARASLPSAEFREQALRIAAEQRQVRAEFVFMMGGELAGEVTVDSTGVSQLDEEAEAEGEDDILAGRLANRGRIELNRAIREMSQADAALVAVEVDSALTSERLALEHLQRAFSRTRYILRALTERERLDLSRRLTGALAEASRDVRPLAEATADPRVASLRRALSAIAELAAASSSAPERSTSAAEIAQAVLRVDPASEALQRVASTLTDAGAATARRGNEARALLDRAAVELATVIRVGLLDAPVGTRSLDIDRLDGALADALRRGRVR